MVLIHMLQYLLILRTEIVLLSIQAAILHHAHQIVNILTLANTTRKSSIVINTSSLIIADAKKMSL